MAKQAVLEAALKLSPQERAELVEQLTDSLIDDEPRDSEWESAWSDEIARRLKSIDDGTATLTPVADVLAEARTIIAAHRE